MTFETVNRKSPMKCLAFAKEANLSVRLYLFSSLKVTLNLNNKYPQIAAN
jgi:hypothetical protein